MHLYYFRALGSALVCISVHNFQKIPHFPHYIDTYDHSLECFPVSVSSLWTGECVLRLQLRHLVRMSESRDERMWCEGGVLETALRLSLFSRQAIPGACGDILVRVGSPIVL